MIRASRVHGDSLGRVMNEERNLTLRDYGRVVWRRKWIVVAAVITALAGALAMSFLQDPIYEAEAQMLVEPRSGEAVFQQDPQLAVANLERAIQTEIRVLEGQRVRERVQEDLGLEELPPEVERQPGRLDRRRVGAGCAAAIRGRRRSSPTPTSTPTSRRGRSWRCRS